MQTRLKEENDRMAVALEDGRKLIAHELEGVQMSPEREGQWQALLTRPETGAEQIEAALSVFLSGRKGRLRIWRGRKRKRSRQNARLEEKLRQAEETNRQLDLLEKERAGLSLLLSGKEERRRWKRGSPLRRRRKRRLRPGRIFRREKRSGTRDFRSRREKREAFASAEKGPCRRFGSGGRTEAA